MFRNYFDYRSFSHGFINIFLSFFHKVSMVSLYKDHEFFLFLPAVANIFAEGVHILYFDARPVV